MEESDIDILIIQPGLSLTGDKGRLAEAHKEGNFMNAAPPRGEKFPAQPRRERNLGPSEITEIFETDAMMVS